MFFLFCFSIRMNRLISHRHVNSERMIHLPPAPAATLYTFYSAFPLFCFFPSCCAHSCRQKLGDIARSPYLSLPLPCPQFTATRSPEKTHHQLLRGVLRCVLDHRYEERELSRGANKKRPCAAGHLRPACSAPVQRRGCRPSCL